MQKKLVQIFLKNLCVYVCVWVYVLSVGGGVICFVAFLLVRVYIKDIWHFAGGLKLSLYGFSKRIDNDLMVLPKQIDNSNNILNMITL